MNENAKDEAAKARYEQQQESELRIQLQKDENERTALRLEKERLEREKASTPVPVIEILSGTGNQWASANYRLKFKAENATSVTVNGTEVANHSWATYDSTIPLPTDRTTIDLLASNTYHSAKTSLVVTRDKTEQEVKEEARVKEESENKAMMKELYGIANDASVGTSFADKTVKWFAYLWLNNHDSIAGAVTAMQLFYLSRFDPLNTEEEKVFFQSPESGAEFMTRTAFLLVKLRKLKGHEDFKKLWDYIVGCQSAVNQRIYNEVSLWNTIRYLDSSTEGIGDNAINGTAPEYLWIAAAIYAKLLNGN